MRLSPVNTLNFLPFISRATVNRATSTPSQQRHWLLIATQK